MKTISGTARRFVRILVVLSTAISGEVVADQIPEPIGRWPYGSSLAVTINGTRAYFGNGSVLQIADITDPATPVVVGEVEVPSFIKDIDVVDDIAYVAAMGGGLLTVDVATPAAPFVLGSSNYPEEAISVAVVGDLALVADRTVGLKILDVSVPSQPSPLGELSSSSLCYGVAASGVHVYLTCNIGLLVIDVTAPSAPVQVGLLDAFFDGGIEVVGSTGYASTGAGLHEIYLDSPTAPQLVDFYYTGGSPRNAVISGGLGYVATAHAGLAVVSFQPSAPNPIGNLDTPHGIADVAHVGNHVLAADGRGGLKSIDVSDPSSPVELTSTGAAGVARRMATVGDLVLVADLDIRVLRRIAPDVLVEIGHLATPGGSRDVAVSGSLAFVADGAEGLLVVDISDPSAPVAAGSVDTPGEALGVAIRGNHVVVADREGGLQIIDVSLPSAPFVASSVSTTGDVEDVVVSGDLAYLAESSVGLTIYDISDPTAPVHVGSGTIPLYPLAVAVSPTKAYVVTYLSELVVYDISNPSSPGILGSWTGYGFFRDVAAQQDSVYVADDYSGLHVIDVGAPENPRWVKTYDLQRPCGVHVAGDTLFSGDSAAGVSIYRTDTSVFYSGFESGDTGAWSSTVGGTFSISAGYGVTQLHLTTP